MDDSESIATTIRMDENKQVLPLLPFSPLRISLIITPLVSFLTPSHLTFHPFPL
jgi:hypothetical protein